MNTNRLQLIAQAAKLVQSENKNSFKGIERQVLSIVDKEYTTNKKDVASLDYINELDFNS
jgi:hypothetical protein